MSATGREFGVEINQPSVDNREDPSAEQLDNQVMDSDDTNESVANLRGWLDEFGKKNRQHFEKNIATSATADVKLSPIRRPTVRRSFETPGPTPLPGEAAHILARRLTATNRLRPKQQPAPDVPQGIQATNDGYASVAQLSKWLADDPTSTKKVRHLRRGANILAKAKNFDKGLSNTIAIENKIQRGSVENHKKLFDGASAKSSVGVPTSASRNNAPYRPKYAQSEIITRNERSDYGGLAKQKWRERAKENEEVELQLKPTVSVDTTKSVSVDGPPSFKSECSLRTSMSSTSRRSSPASSRASSPVAAKEEAHRASPVGFFKARELLVKRAIANGNSVDVVVQRRKAKFENLSKEARRLSTASHHGLLKSSWDSEDGTTYVKKFVSDIPAKKSFEDLP